jgi:hypothetical protein
LQWQPYPGGQGKVEAHLAFETKLSNGRYQVEAGIYDQAAGRNLLSNSGQEMVLLDTIVIEDSAVPADPTTLGDYSVAAQGSIWPISLSQAARTSVTQNIHIEMSIGYDLSDLPEGDYLLKLHYAAPDWQQVTTGRSPIDGMSDYLPLTEREGELTVNFSGNPQEMQSIVGTSSPIPVLILGQLHELSGGGQQFEALVTVTSGEFPLLLDSIEATTYRIVGEETQN